MRRIVGKDKKGRTVLIPLIAPFEIIQYNFLRNVEKSEEWLVWGLGRFNNLPLYRYYAARMGSKYYDDNIYLPTYIIIFIIRYIRLIYGSSIRYLQDW